jgi:AcrR family transcriptional regulator
MPPRSPTKKARNAAKNGPGRPARRRDGDVLEAAVKVFYERGYSDATVQDVADELGILKGSLYHYIETKEDLLFQLIEGVHTEVLLILEEVQVVADLDPLERLELYVRRQVEYNIGNLARISVYYHDLDRLTGERLAYVKDSRRAHTDFVADLIGEAQKKNLTKNSEDPRLLANCVFGTIIWTYRWFRPGRMSRKAVVDTCVQQALHGVAG